MLSTITTRITRKKYLARQLAALLLCCIVSLSAAPGALAVDLMEHNSFYIKQARRGTCTLASTAMMLRRRAYLNGMEEWTEVTEQDVRPTAWQGGLSHLFTYRNMTVGYGTLPAGAQAREQALIQLLAAHPEGIVAYDRTSPHAILLTDYTNGVFYCADPAGGTGTGRIPVSEASIRLANVSCYWYILQDTNTTTDAMAPGQLRIEGMFYPANVQLGRPFMLGGAVQSAQGYDLAQITLRLFDAAGQLVWEADAALAPGQQEWYFDQFNGQLCFETLPEGVYTLNLLARDASGQALCFVQDFTVSAAPAQTLYYWSVLDAAGEKLMDVAAPVEEQAPAWQNTLSRLAGWLGL